jgi:hypothetical protein
VLIVEFTRATVRHLVDTSAECDVRMSLPSMLDGQQRTVNVRSIIATMVNAGGRPARSRTHGIPPMQCTATAKGTGERCKNYVLPGSPVCAMHGMTGNGFRKAEERVTLAQLYERTPREHPWEVVLDATHTAVAAALDKLGLTEPWRAYALQVAHRALLGDEAQGDEPQPPDDPVVQEYDVGPRNVPAIEAVPSTPVPCDVTVLHDDALRDVGELVLAELAMRDIVG